VVIGVVAAPFVVVGVAYGVFALMTRGAPPPPSFTRPVRAAYDARLDGRWYAKDCAAITIAGGWLLSSKPGRGGGASRVPLVSAPVDLTRLHRGGPPLTIQLHEAAYALRWSGRSLELSRQDGARPIRFQRLRNPC
jgi:hypothetical protein